MIKVKVNGKKGVTTSVIPHRNGKFPVWFGDVVKFINNNNVELINKDFEPIKCECGSVDFRDYCTSKIDYMEVERDRICNKCNSLIGCWAYGSWKV